MVKKIGTIKIHSSIDVITNSSSELFCTVKGEERAIKSIIDDIVDGFGCTAVDISVDESYDNETDKYITGQYDINYSYECSHEPCEMMLDKIKKELNLIE